MKTLVITVNMDDADVEALNCLSQHVTKEGVPYFVLKADTPDLVNKVGALCREAFVWHEHVSQAIAKDGYENHLP